VADKVVSYIVQRFPVNVISRKLGLFEQSSVELWLLVSTLVLGCQICLFFMEKLLTVNSKAVIVGVELHLGLLKGTVDGFLTVIVSICSWK